jgi:ABC-type transport system substrate-binding protein
MKTRSIHPCKTQGIHRRELLKAGLAAGAALSVWPLYDPCALWGPGSGATEAGGILRVRGWDPVHFDHHLTINNFTNYVLSFVHSRLVRHKPGADVPPGTFIVEPDVAERWEALDDTTYVFSLRKGVKWHNKPPSMAASWWLRDMLGIAPGAIFMRTDQSPFNDVRVRRAIPGNDLAQRLYIPR